MGRSTCYLNTDTFLYFWLCSGRDRRQTCMALCLLQVVSDKIQTPETDRRLGQRVRTAD